MRSEAKNIPALDIREVSYSVNGRQILQSISWTVQEGEHWAVLGPNGSGKTTLLKVASGYLWPNAGGTVYRKGQSLIDLRELRKSIGWVTSILLAQIPPREQVLRTVVSGRFAQIGLLEGPWGEPGAADYGDAATCLGALGCAELAAREFGSLSQGEQQKVMIARALMTRPYVIFLDEPCAGMDPGAREIFLAALEKLGKQQNVPALIYVTHHVEEILPLFERTLILRGGRVFRSGPTPALLDGAVLRELYGVSLRVIRQGGRYWPLV